MALFLAPQFQFWFEGEPASGGQVYVYQTGGTTTPVLLYTNGSLTQPAANPFTLDENGECSFYVSSTVNLRMDAYTSTGTFIESLDPVYVVPDLTTLNQAVNSNIGGLVNKFRNPNMDVAQRGTSGTVTSTNTNYTLDGWMIGAVGSTVSWSQTNSVLPANGQSSNVLLIVGASSMTDTFVRHRIESYDAEALAGQQVTFQIWAQGASVNSAPALTMKYPTARDNYGSTVVFLNAVSLQPLVAGTGQILSYTVGCPAGVINGLEIDIDFGNAFTANTFGVYLAQADIRVTSSVSSGLNNNPPPVELRPFQFELAWCQRFLPTFKAASVTSILGVGYGQSTTLAYILINFQVPTRAVCTGITVDNAVHMTLIDGTNTIVSTAIAGSLYGLNSAQIQITVASGLTQFRPYSCYFNNTSGLLIFTGAEL